ncbi:cyclin-dependent kinase inhibitor 3-like [Typha latifolia]|uniref:cyclin-dependent kinase inhibitor 3-like n=1 Tax=Typha latifolia TaxID=4733 RepID=UPI003C30E7EC
MGKYTRKCRGAGELGVMTRSRATAAKRRKVAEVLAEDYLQLRSRRLVMARRITRTAANSSRKRRRSTESSCQISRCSSNTSGEVVALRSADPEDCDDLVSSVSFSESRRERRETTPSSEPRGEKMPSDAEIEEFFADAERAEVERFAKKYNYDIVNDVPFGGRFEWVRLGC